MEPSNLGVAGREAAPVPDVTSGPTTGDHVPPRRPVIIVGPRTVPSPPTRAEAVQPTAASKRWGVVVGAVLLLVLLTAVVLAVAIVGMTGVRAASATDDPVRVGTGVLSVTA
jgi:hypothetical protein